MDNQSVFEIACGYKYFAGDVAGAVAVIAARAVGVKALKLENITGRIYCRLILLSRLCGLGVLGVIITKPRFGNVSIAIMTRDSKSGITEVNRGWCLSLFIVL
jgi:hypothetical protein